MIRRNLFLFVGLIVVIGMGFTIVNKVLTYYASPNYAVSRLVKAIESKDFNTAKSICPEFSDGTKISEKSYNLFFEELKKTKNERILLNQSNFKQKKTENLLSKTIFLPEKRYIQVSTRYLDEEVSVSNGNKAIKIEDNKIGPLIANSYSLTFEIKNPITGISIKREKIKLDENQEIVLTEEKTLVENEELQKKLINTVSNFFYSFNESIQNNLNFDSLSYVEEELKNQIIQSIGVLKEYITNYSQGYQTIIMNCDSVKFEENLSSVKFDIYIDKKTSIKLTEEISDFNVFNEESRNAKVKLLFDKENNDWVVSDIDFETYSQNPEEWKKIRQIKLATENIATWSKNDGALI